MSDDEEQTFDYHGTYEKNKSSTYRKQAKSLTARKHYSHKTMKKYLDEESLDKVHKLVPNLKGSSLK